MNPLYGRRFRLLHWAVDQAMTNALAQMDLTAAQGHIMGYLAHQDAPPCPKDLEEAFHLSHPTVSGLLSRLEKKDFIALRPDPQDRRCKRIYIMPKGQACNQTMHQTILDIENRLVESFTSQEQAEFTRLLDMAIHNMGADQCCRKAHHEKEEPNEND